ncbi:MAG: hypothetical protein M1486_00180 [Gammaproteobacteria bacterium]|nr:hypothetical protein [Gammaproteobacteria bacterium]
MELKHDSNITTSGENSKEIKGQQLVDFFIKDQLNQDLKIEINAHLTEVEVNKAYNKVALTCPKLFSLFKPNFKSELVTKLLTCIARGQQDEVEQLLKTSPELMIEKATFTDFSGRTFSNISAFEFVLWALDARYMIDMMFRCLPKDETGLNLAGKLEEQYYNHQEQGVAYTLNGRTTNEKHFNFSHLTDALQTYVDNYNNWDSTERKEWWCIVVGNAQCYVPAHAIQHYCDRNVPFYPLPKFEAEQFVRTLKFYNNKNNKEMIWAGINTFSDSVGCESFCFSDPWGGGGLASTNGWLAQQFQPGPFLEVVANDLAAVKALYETRKSDYIAIPSKLASLFEKKATEDESPKNRGVL